MLHSNYVRLCPVTLPYKGRQDYMHPFDVAKPKMKRGYEDYLEPVKALLEAAGITYGEANMTVDEKLVLVGNTQRKPHPHVDGCFRPANQDWYHPTPSWAHYCNELPIQRMAVIVASNFAACKVWRGMFDGKPTADGDLSHISDQLGPGRILPANVGYLLSPDCVHESLPMTEPTKRTFLRIALPLTEESQSC